MLGIRNRYHYTVWSIVLVFGSKLLHSQEVIKDCMSTCNQSQSLHQCPLPDCTYATSEQWRLKKHVQAIHAKFKRYKCSMCNFRAASALAMARHTQGQHPDKYYQCTFCSFKTPYSHGLRSHVPRAHGVKRSAQ